MKKADLAHYTVVGSFHAFFVDHGVVAAHRTAIKRAKGQDRHRLRQEACRATEARPFRLLIGDRGAAAQTADGPDHRSVEQGGLRWASHPTSRRPPGRGVDLLTDYAADEGIKLQVYPGRPKSLFPPTAFVDRITETLEWSGTGWPQRTVRAEVVVVHGVFDSKEAVDQKDAFVDGFVYWVADNVHAAGANTTIGLAVRRGRARVAARLARRRTPPTGPTPIYYATRLTLEGFAGG